MKRLEITPHIESLLRAAYGPDADLTVLAVYEFIAANLQPLRKRGGIYDRARFTEATLREMAEAVSKESVQLILNHDDSQMPVGRVFAAELKGEDLHTLTAIPLTTQAELCANIDSGTYDQVSVGILPSRLLCSECGFDYMSDEATFDNWWDLTCNENHTVGQNGVHVRLAGLSSWFEMSIVGKGAVPGARSVDKSNSAFAQSTSFQRLAASGVPERKLVCCNSVHQPFPKEPKMDTTEFVAKLSEAVAGRTEAEAKLTAAAAQVEALTAAAAERDAKIAELTAALAAAQAKLEAGPVNQEDYEAMLASLTEITKRSRVALGESAEDLPTAPKDLITILTASQERLSAIIPNGAVSRPAVSDVKVVAVSNGARAFTTKL